MNYTQLSCKWFIEIWCGTKTYHFLSDDKLKGPKILTSKLISDGRVKVGQTENTYNMVEDKQTLNFDSCAICGESIEGGSEEALKSHCFLKHKGKLFKCDGCEHSFKYRLYLTDHKMRKHHVEPPSGLTLYLCQLCPYSSLCKEYMENHFRTKHWDGAKSKKSNTIKGRGGQYQCHVCGKDFANKHYVDQHIARTHNKVRNVNCPYPDCKFTTYNRNGLKNHLKIHTATLEDRKAYKGFTCQECGAKSLSKGHLINHIKAVHRKVKEYGCKICQLRFNNIGNCKEHIGLKHMGFKDAKEWRLKENADIRKSAETHQAFEYVPDQEWQEEFKRLMQKWC